jgi:hypothetical protein
MWFNQMHSWWKCRAEWLLLLLSRDTNLIHSIFSQLHATPYVICINVINALLVVTKFIPSKQNFQGQVTSDNYITFRAANQIAMHSRHHFQSQIHSLTRSARASPPLETTVALLRTFPFQISFSRVSSRLISHREEEHKWGQNLKNNWKYNCI